MKATQNYTLLAAEDVIFSVLCWVSLIKLMTIDTSCNEKILII